MNTNVVLAGKTIYVTPSGFKVTQRGKVMSASETYAKLNKSDRRRLRKTARRLGFDRHARALNA